MNNGTKPKFKALKEIIFSECNIITAIHTIKSNKGSKTPGIDEKTIEDYLYRDYEEIIIDVQQTANRYNPKPVRRKWIDKPGKKEKRPLGIPAIIDRIIQQCIKQIIEPICEAQFYPYSFGFRPMRGAEMALRRVENISFMTDCRWAIEGDIKGFFDNVNHNKLIKCLWNIGIHDRRVLMIIKQMLKAGVMGQTKVTDLGTPQGGILSPLLANVYLNKFDWHVHKQWNGKKTQKRYGRDDHRIYALRKRSNLKPMYLIRYADDWIILTNSKSNAEKIKYQMKGYLKDKLALELSEEKTKITNMGKKAVDFLGFKIGLRKSNIGVQGYVNYSKPDIKRLERKLDNLVKEIRYLKVQKTKEEGIRQITEINSIIRGITNYYNCATMVNKVMHKYSNIIKYKCYKKLKRANLNPEWVEANKSDNLRKVHENYTTKLPTIKHKGLNIAITDLSFVRWEQTAMKNQAETPYTTEGRELYKKRTNKKRTNPRVGLELNTEYLKWLTLKNKGIYNFEYFMNREYAFNRDNWKCKCCGKMLLPEEVHIHHVNNKLPIHKINKVVNLVTTCIWCHGQIHSANEVDESLVTEKQLKAIKRFRNRLNN